MQKITIFVTLLHYATDYMEKIMIIQSAIKEKLTAKFSPQSLEIFDDSHKHAGHAGNPDGLSETHIGIIITADYFENLSRIERARAVHSCIAEEINKIHAITVLKITTTAELEKL